MMTITTSSSISVKARGRAGRTSVEHDDNANTRQARDHTKMCNADLLAGTPSINVFQSLLPRAFAGIKRGRSGGAGEHAACRSIVLACRRSSPVDAFDSAAYTAAPRKDASGSAQRLQRAAQHVGQPLQQAGRFQDAAGHDDLERRDAPHRREPHVRPTLRSAISASRW